MMELADPGTDAGNPMSAAGRNHNPADNGWRAVRMNPSAREAITYYNPMEEREADQAPLQAKLIRRIFGYTKPYAVKRNCLFALTFTRGLQMPCWRG